MSKAFLETFAAVSSSIPFNPKWKNGTGYLDGAAHGETMPVIPTGLTVKSVDDYNRKILITSISDSQGNQAGNVVIFERYTNGENGVIVSNAPSGIRKKYDFLENGSINEENFRKFHLR